MSLPKTRFLIRNSASTIMPVMTIFKMLSGMLLPAVFTVLLSFNNTFAQTAEEYNDMGAHKSSNGDWRGAIDDYNKAIELNPGFESAYGWRGYAKAKLGDYKDAIQDYNKAIELLSKTSLADSYNKAVMAEYYYDRGAAKDNLGDITGAIEDYNKAIELDPVFQSAYYNRGLAEEERAKYLSAIQDYSKAIEINPKDEDAYIARGVTKGKLGDYKGAILDLNMAIEHRMFHQCLELLLIPTSSYSY